MKRIENLEVPRLKQFMKMMMFAVMAMSLPVMARADEVAAVVTPKTDTGDTAWLLASSALVLLMTPALALFYGGMVRAKNILNMLMQSFICMSVITILWVIIGYSLAFAPGTAFLGGKAWLGLTGVGQEPHSFYAATTPHLTFMVFQLMFAIITPALISGAIAERMKFSSYLVFITLWSLIVYSPLAHMVWSENGYLLKYGALDFAGGTVVHISSGFSALVLCILLGKRKLSPHEDTRPHNLPMTLLGAGILWFGWYGFNGGSACASNGLAVSAFTVTHIAAAVAGLVWILIEWVVYKKPTALGFATGAVAGLVAITPGSGFVTPMGSIIIGAGVCFVSFGAIKLKSKFGYDDTLDVFGVHGVGGLFGALMTGVFASKAVNSAGANGLAYGGGIELLIKQAVGAGVAIVMAVVGTLIIGMIIKATMGLTVSPDAEEAGLDLSEHGESGYAGAGAGEHEAHGVAAVAAEPFGKPAVAVD